VNVAFSSLALVLAAPASGAAHLNVDSQELVVGQQVALRVSVDAAQQPIQPELSAPDGLRLQVAGPPSFSSSFVFDGQNTSRQSTWTWVYALTAMQAGNYRLGPALVGTQSTQAISVRVDESRDQELERLSAGLNVTQAYVGQTVIWNASFDTQLRGQPEGWRLPPLPGLELDPLVREQSENLVSSLNGQRIAGYRYALALRVAEPRELETAASTFSLLIAVRNQGRVERSRQVFTAPGQSLQLLAQPAGRDANWSGLVGDFQVSLVPERTQIALGETLSMTLRVEGNASMAGWLPPTLELDGLKVFAELPKLGGALSEQDYRGAGERSFTVLPEAPGVLDVPVVALQILDPNTGEYRVILTEPFQVRVLAGQELEPKRQSFAPLEPSVSEGPATLEPRDPMGRSQLFAWSQPGVLLALLGPFLVFLAATVWRWPRGIPAAGRSFSEEIQALSDGDLAGAQSLLRRVQESLGQAPQQISSDPGLWSELQAARFGGGEPQALVKRVRQALEALLEGG
jgi:hypothetical protein